jgi:hypothetical protein
MIEYSMKKELAANYAEKPVLVLENLILKLCLFIKPVSPDSRLKVLNKIIYKLIFSFSPPSARLPVTSA